MPIPALVSLMPMPSYAFQKGRFTIFKNESRFSRKLKIKKIPFRHILQIPYPVLK